MQIFKKNYVVLMLAAMITRGFSFKCFQCNSAEHPECADIVANDTSSPFLQECVAHYENEAPFCRKIVSKVLEGEYSRIVRSCGWILDEKFERKDFCKKSDSNFILRMHCACFSEMCNTSIRHNTAFWILPASLGLIFIHCTKFNKIR